MLRSQASQGLGVGENIRNQCRSVKARAWSDEDPFGASVGCGMLRLKCQAPKGIHACKASVNIKGAKVVRGNARTVVKGNSQVRVQLSGSLRKQLARRGQVRRELVIVTEQHEGTLPVREKSRKMVTFT